MASTALAPPRHACRGPLERTRAIRAVHRARPRFGEAGEGFAGLLRRHRAGQDARADQEHLLLAERCARGRESPRSESACASETRERRLERLRLRQRAEEAGSISASSTWGWCGERLGEARRGAEHARDQSDEIGVLPQQREELGAAVQAAEKAVEGDEGGIGILGARECVDEQRHELGEDRARRRPAQRPRWRRRASGAPSRDASIGWRKPMRAELVERLGVVGFRREDKAAPLGGARRRVLEQPRIVALDGAEVAEQRRGEGVAIGDNR